MKEISRLSVGIILLGLAIYLSLNFEDVSTQTTENEASETSEPSEPDWQASTETTTAFASQFQGDSFARPQFDSATPAPARPLSSIGSTPPLDLSLPPSIADQYRPMQPLVVSGQLSVESDLVPVQPKPSFAGTISYVQQIHTIRDGDTLQSIAREYYGSADRYLDIYLLNKNVLANPAHLPTGVEIRIPGE